MDLDDLPGIAYQLMLFAIKGQKRRILCGILEHIDRLDQEIAAAEQAAAKVKPWSLVFFFFVVACSVKWKRSSNSGSPWSLPGCPPLSIPSFF